MMRLVPSCPTTVHAVRHAQRWFPSLHRHCDGSLLMYIQCGYDAHFSPFGRWRSFDDGRSWIEEEENLPRCQIAHSLPDRTLFELDCYGFVDPKSPDTYCFYGAWSAPAALKPGIAGSSGHSAFYHGGQQFGEDWLGRDDAGIRRDVFRVQAPSASPNSLRQLGGHGYPHHPWWPLINRLYSPDVRGDAVLTGINITAVADYRDGLLAVGYATHRDDAKAGASISSVFCYESCDQGRSWREISVVARGTTATPEGFNESTLTLLADGRLHSVIRSGDLLHQTWSSDGGRSWSNPEPIRVLDSPLRPRMVWPRCAKLDDGTLVLAYGRPGKHLLFDLSGTGRAWQGHLDLHAWELKAQEMAGVPEHQRLRGDTERCVRFWDSGDYLSVVTAGPRDMLVTYDVQNYIEHPGSAPIAGVRMVRVRLDG